MSTNDDLASRIEQSLRKEKKTSEFAKLEAPSGTIEVSSSLVQQLAAVGICTHFARREVTSTQLCKFNGSTNDCPIQIKEAKPNRWVFSECPLTKNK